MLLYLGFIGGQVDDSATDILPLSLWRVELVELRNTQLLQQQLLDHVLMSLHGFSPGVLCAVEEAVRLSLFTLKRIIAKLVRVNVD